MVRKQFSYHNLHNIKSLLIQYLIFFEKLIKIALEIFFGDVIV